MKLNSTRFVVVLSNHHMFPFKLKYSISYLICLLTVFSGHSQLISEDSTEFETVWCNEFSCFPIANGDVINDRLNCIQNEVILDYNGYTKGFFDYFLIRKRSYINTMLERKELYFPFIEEQLAQYSLPDELKYMTIIESGLNTRAQSPAGAVGMWQFMKTTGQLYGITSNWYFDERMDYEKATIAACKFLNDLHRQLGDWRLAIAAYNCGAGNVRKAIRKSGYSKDFWTIYPHLPKETRGYVPQFMAVMYAMSYAPEHGFYADSVEYFPESDSVIINSYFNLEAYCNASNYCFESLIKLNPEIKRSVIIDSIQYPLRLPVDLAEEFRANRRHYLDSCAKKSDEELNYATRKYPGNTDGKMKTYYTVKSGDYLSKIATHYNVGVTDLRRWNSMNSNMIHPGQKLVIWKDPSYFKNDAQKQMQVKQNLNENKLLDIPENKMYTVQPGDTLWDISRKFKDVSIEQIKQWNNLNTESLKVGQTLKLGT